MAYTFYTNGVLEKDGYYVPIDELNLDYREYLAWVALGNTPDSVDGSVYLAKLEDNKVSIADIKAAYQTMITRLEQIENSGAIPFTQAGFNQVVAAIKDEATYIKRIMKFIKATI